MTDHQKPTIITATEMQKLSGQIIKRAFKGEHFIVERGGLPTVAIISVNEYKRLETASHHTHINQDTKD